MKNKKKCLKTEISTEIKYRNSFSLRRAICVLLLSEIYIIYRDYVYSIEKFTRIVVLVSYY